MNHTRVSFIIPQSPKHLVLETALKYAYQMAIFVLFTAYLGWTSQNNYKARLTIAGPRGLPLFGCIFQIRSGHAKALSAWTDRYQDIFRIVLGNKEAVVLNTRAAVAKTLVQQGSVFQTRPEWDLWHETFVHSADTGGVLTIGTAKWTTDVSRLRKLLGPHTTAQRLPRFNHFVSRRYLRLIKLLAKAEAKPQDLGLHWWSTTVGLTTDQLVGQTHDDEFVKLICETEIGIFRLRALGSPLPDWVPLLGRFAALQNAASAGVRHIFQACGFSVPAILRNATVERCNELRLNQSKYCKEQLASLNERISNGDTTPSQLGDLFRSLPERLPDKDEYMIMTTLSGSGMAIGTTLTWLMSYIASHPEIQTKAFAAINEVYKGQVPDPHDTDRIEYLKALALEAGRYWTAIRLGFFRETDADSHIDNHFIPKGTMIIYNSHQINRDPAGYDNPYEFIPERWMNGKQGRTDVIGVAGDKIGVPHMGHGAGRRLCLGVPNVNKSFYGVLALTLYFFRLERAHLDSEGMKTVFPSFRACRQSSLEMDPVHDQVSQCDGQALPCASGIRLTARDKGQLNEWIDMGHQTLRDFEAPWA